MLNPDLECTLLPLSGFPVYVTFRSVELARFMLLMLNALKYEKASLGEERRRKDEKKGERKAQAHAQARSSVHLPASPFLIPDFQNIEFVLAPCVWVRFARNLHD